MTQGAKRLSDVGDRHKKHTDDVTDIYSLIRTKHLSPQRIQMPSGGTSSASPRQGGESGGFLRTSGGVMMGPIAFSPELVVINGTGHIDISALSQEDSTYVLMTGAGSPDDLNWIDGARFRGQLLFLQGTASQVINIKHATTPGTNGNIVTPNGADVVLDGTVATNGVPVATLIFDVTVAGLGAWRIISSGGSGASSSNAIKAQVRVATTTNGALATAYENGDTIDGVALVTGNRILLKDQTTGSQNGIYTVNATGAPTRATDFDTDAEILSGVIFTVLEGTANADSLWMLTNNPVLGVDPMNFLRIGGGNTSFADNVFEIHDDGDATKKLYFQLSNLLTGFNNFITTEPITTAGKTWTLPNADTILAGLAVNNIFTIDNFFNADVTLGNLQSADSVIFKSKPKLINPAGTFYYIIETSAIVGSDKSVFLPLMTATDTFMLNSTYAQVTNKDFKANTCQFVDSTFGGKAFVFDCSGITDPATRTIIVPNANGTMFITPAVLTLNMNGQDMDNVNSIITNAGIPASAGTIRMGNNETVAWDLIGAGNGTIRFDSTDSFIVAVNGGDDFVFDSTKLNLKSNYIITSSGTVAASGVLRLANAEIIAWRNAGNTADLTITGNASDQIEVQFFKAQQINSSAATPATSGFIRCGNNEVGLGWDLAGAGNGTLEVNSSDIFDFRLNAVSKLQISTNGIDVLANYISLSDRADPTAPTGLSKGYFYVKDVGGISKPFYIGDGQAAVDLTAGGGSQTPWTSDIDADGFDLKDLSNIEFRQTTGAPASSVPYINWDGSTKMALNVPGGDNFVFTDGGSGLLTIETGGTLQWNVSSALHRIDVISTALQLMSEGTGDFVELWSGTARTNATISIGDLNTIMRTASAATAGYDLYFHYTNGTTTGQPGLGSIIWEAEDSANNQKPYAGIQTGIIDDTSSSRDATLVLYAAQNTLASVSSVSSLLKAIEIQGGGTSGKIGFFGVAPVVRQSPASNSGAIITALQNLGLFV